MCKTSRKLTVLRTVLYVLQLISLQNNVKSASIISLSLIGGCEHAHLLAVGQSRSGEGHVRADCMR